MSTSALSATTTLWVTACQKAQCLPRSVRVPVVPVVGEGHVRQEGVASAAAQAFARARSGSVAPGIVAQPVFMRNSAC